MIHAKRTETAHMEHNVFLNIVCNFLFYLCFMKAVFSLTYRKISHSKPL